MRELFPREVVDGPLFRIRPAEIDARVARLRAAFPGSIGFNVRTNPHPAVLRAVVAAGVRALGVCSRREAEAVRGSGVEIVFLNPFATAATLRDVVQLHPSARFVVDGVDTLDHVCTATGDAICRVSVRMTPDAIDVVGVARERGLDVALTVHPAPASVDALRDTLQAAKQIDASCEIDLGVTTTGTPPFTIEDAEAFCRAAESEARCLQIDPARLRITPAGAIAGASCSAVVRILLRKGDRLHLDDGRFGWLYILGREAWHTQRPLSARAYRVGEERLDALDSADLMRFRAFGPTCDSYDELAMPLLLPRDVVEGDLVEIDGIGADSVLCASHFNGFYPNRYAVLEQENLA